MLPTLAVSFAVQLVLWLAASVGLKRVAAAQPPEGPAPPLPLSVVVAAHDEAETLPALLAALAAQTHAPFEVVVVDDRSSDGTADVVRQLAARQPGAAPERTTGATAVRVVRVGAEASAASGLPPKKYAVTQGIAAARHERIVVTDADGRPPPTWLSTLARHAAPDGKDTGAVLVGFGPYVAAPGWLNRFVRFETVQTAVWAAAAIGLGRPWQAVGRNLSYPKAVFEAVGGFRSSAGSLSGDDDLLLHEIVRQRAAAVHYVLDADASVASAAPSGWGAFWRQKRRHASAGAHYPAWALGALGAMHVTALALWVGAPLLHALTGSAAGWGLLAAKLLVQSAVLRLFRDALGTEGDLGLALPLLDAASAAYHAAFAALGLLPAPQRW